MVKASGDAGALTNKLVLTKDDPTGDAVFGIDNTFGSRAIDEGVLAPYAAKLPDGADAVRAARATTTTTSRRSTPATSASTSTTPGSPTRASRSRRRSTTW